MKFLNHTKEKIKETNITKKVIKDRKKENSSITKTKLHKDELKEKIKEEKKNNQHKSIKIIKNRVFFAKNILKLN